MSLLEKECFNSIFIAATTLQAKRMIDMGIWSGIERHLFDSWCQQYSTESELILRSLILRNLVFRSKEQVRSLLTQSLDKNIPQELFNITGDEQVFKNIISLCSFKTTCKDLIIVPVIRDSDPPTKSGPLIARLFKRLANVNDNVM